MAKNKSNYLDWIPVQNAQFEAGESNLVVLLSPKASNPLGKWLIRKLKTTPNYRIQLDQFGTFIWQSIDSHRTIHEICNDLKQHFGDDVEPVHERVSLFIKSLAARSLITYRQ